MLFFFSCVNEQEKTIILESEHPENMMFEITNTGNYSVEFSLVMNNLDLSNNTNITDNGLKHVRNLTYLNLWNNTNITNEGLKYLSNLTTLHIYNR